VASGDPYGAQTGVTIGGVEFPEENGGGPGARLRKRRQAKRSSGGSPNVIDTLCRSGWTFVSSLTMYRAVPIQEKDWAEDGIDVRGHAESRVVDFSGSFFETTNGGKQTNELIWRCTALMQWSMPTVRNDGLKGGTFFASGSAMTSGRKGRILLLRTCAPRGEIEYWMKDLHPLSIRHDSLLEKPKPIASGTCGHGIQKYSWRAIPL